MIIQKRFLFKKNCIPEMDPAVSHSGTTDVSSQPSLPKSLSNISGSSLSFPPQKLFFIENTLYSQLVITFTFFTNNASEFNNVINRFLKNHKKLKNCVLKTKVILDLILFIQHLVRDFTYRYLRGEL